MRRARRGIWPYAATAPGGRPDRKACPAGIRAGAAAAAAVGPAGGEGRPSALETPPWAADLLDLTERSVPAEDPDRIDAEIARIAAASPRLSAVFCASAASGVALLLARRWEQVLADLDLPIPPLLALDEAEPDGGAAEGFAVLAARPRLDGIEAQEARLDARARAVHAHYLGLIGDTGGDMGVPSRRPWADLPERYREDNRAAADHLAFKMARAGLALVAPDGGSGLRALPAASVEVLAEAEHARWMAARRVAGWTHGPRDDAAQTHPTLCPMPIWMNRPATRTAIRWPGCPRLSPWGARRWHANGRSGSAALRRRQRLLPWRRCGGFILTGCPCCTVGWRRANLPFWLRRSRPAT